MLRSLNVIVRKVGRIILTSRRRERIEAKQIEIPSLPEDDALTMLRARGESLGRKQILDAGDSKLKHYARQLGCKPLSLEVFVHAIEPGVSLDHAFQRVARLQEAELGEFLFEDAWHRISQKIKVLLLLMTSIADVHDEVLLKLSCQECGVTVRDAEDALQESLGIATITKSSGHLTIAFADEFIRFCDNRFVDVNGEKLPANNTVERVKSRYATYLKGISSILPGKDAKAFRHAISKAAYAAASQGKTDDAIIFYEEAVVVDGNNPFLWDRFAYFLLKQRRYKEALIKASRATKVGPQEPTVWFTKGMVEARMGNVPEAVKSLHRATDLGFDEHRAWVQRAYAHLNSDGKDLDAIDHCISKARSTCPRNDAFKEKHLEEVLRLETRLKQLRKERVD